MRTESNLVKAPNREQTFTAQQIKEFAACCDPVTGCEYFMRNFFYIQHPVKGQLLFEPYEYQIGLIQTYVNYRNSIALMPRQTGKCLQAETIINIRNKTTGVSYDIPIGIFHEYRAAICRGEQPPDISVYQRKDVPGV